MATDPRTRILVIDDDPTIRELIIRYMGKSGYETLEAEDGGEGIRLLREERPDLLLCDIRMQHTDGLEVLKVVKQESPQTPIIMISGAGLISDVVESLHLGAWDYLIKPFSNLTILGHAVSSTLHRAKLELENRQYRERLVETNRELQSSLAILREDQEAGRQVQAQLLPEAKSRFGEYTFSHIFIPSLYLSGDFLDYFRIDNRYIGFYIADVSGHGSSSAFVTVILKSLVNQALRRYQTHGDIMIIQPNKIFEYLNNEILQSIPGKYLTMFYGILDTESHTLHYSIGGHYPRPIVSADNDSRFLAGEGLPVGMFEFAEYITETLDVPVQFFLAMFSDGIIDMIDAKGLEKKEQYLLQLCADSELSITSVSDNLKLAQVEEPPDDITMFLLHRKG